MKTCALKRKFAQLTPRTQKNVVRAGIFLAAPPLFVGLVMGQTASDHYWTADEAAAQAAASARTAAVVQQTCDQYYAGTAPKDTPSPTKSFTLPPKNSRNVPLTVSARFAIGLKEKPESGECEVTHERKVGRVGTALYART